MHQLPTLPFNKKDLEPYISESTIDVHYGKHHQAYVTNLNTLIPGTEFESLSLEEIILKSYNNAKTVGIFNNAAQVWNHTFYWHCMTKPNTSKMSDRLKAEICKNFGSIDQFLNDFKQAALTQFGSGWAWLVKDGESLKITKTSNAELPMVFNQKALLTCDVWEHAYYIDVQNRRADYVTCFLEHLVNWDFVDNNLFG
ncbi:MAG: superoxide dismutase [Proteobacteria bacterium]|nr:superoxide dismutase [Pseudomonadota bacterium]